MKIKRFKIPIYEYNVIYVELSGSPKEAEKARILLEEIHGDEEDIKELTQEIEEVSMNGGVHWPNLLNLTSLIIIYKHNNEMKKRATVAHEKRHLEDAILKHYNVNDKESAGLLSGWLAKKIP